MTNYSRENITVIHEYITCSTVFFVAGRANNTTQRSLYIRPKETEENKIYLDFKTYSDFVCLISVSHTIQATGHPTHMIMNHLHCISDR